MWLRADVAARRGPALAGRRGGGDRRRWRRRYRRRCGGDQRRRLLRRRRCDSAPDGRRGRGQAGAAGAAALWGGAIGAADVAAHRRDGGRRPPNRDASASFRARRNRRPGGRRGGVAAVGWRPTQAWALRVWGALSAGLAGGLWPSHSHLQPWRSSPCSRSPWGSPPPPARPSAFALASRLERAAASSLTLAVGFRGLSAPTRRRTRVFVSPCGPRHFPLFM